LPANTPGQSRRGKLTPSRSKGCSRPFRSYIDPDRAASSENKLITIINILQVLLTVAYWIIIVQAILSWLIAFNVINTHNDTVRAIWVALDRMTEPLYRPIRKIMPDFGALDLSPLVVLLIIWCLQIALGRLALWWVGAGVL
jgi:YggT family protein